MDMSDKALTEKAFLSGEPYVIYCVSDKTEGGALPELIGKIKQEVSKSKHAQGVEVQPRNLNFT